VAKGWSTGTAHVPAIEPVEELAIRALLIRYATAIDTKDWRLFRSCFADDCCARFGGLTWHGADAVADVFRKAHSPLDDSMHRVLNIAVLAYDGDTATSRSYCDAVLVRRAAPGGDVLHVQGVYADDLRRREGAWRIAKRHFRAVSYRGSLGVMGIDPDQVAIIYGSAVHEL
jgi:3-phenylpropionate/cinnamic acid dioxygenase small subunit